MNSININNEGYSAPNGADNAQNNWAAAFAKREVDKHREAEVLDHPDGSVTSKKLSGEVQYAIATAAEQSADALASAVEANATADSAKALSETAVKESENAYEKSLDAYDKASVAENIAIGSKNKSETAEQRAISAETKADAAVNAASEAVLKAEGVQSDLSTHSRDTDIHTTSEEKADIEQNISTAQETAEKSLQYWKPNTLYKEGQVVYAYSDNDECDLIIECRTTHTSSDSYDSDYSKWDYLLGVTADRAGLSQYANKAYCANCDIYGNDIYDTYANQAELAKKADKPTIITDTESTSYTFDFSDMYNSEMRLQAASTISIIFVDNEYAEDYISGLSFNSGETPTGFDYTDSGIINWVGTDCATSDGLSIFQPSANTHYDIVFYFNGTQFIGLVNGFVPASGNEAV